MTNIDNVSVGGGDTNTEKILISIQWEAWGFHFIPSTGRNICRVLRLIPSESLQ